MLAALVVLHQFQIQPAQGPSDRQSPILVLLAQNGRCKRCIRWESREGEELMHVSQNIFPKLICPPLIPIALAILSRIPSPPIPLPLWSKLTQDLRPADSRWTRIGDRVHFSISVHAPTSFVVPSQTIACARSRLINRAAAKSCTVLFFRFALSSLCSRQ